MITVEEALQKIEAKTPQLGESRVNISDCIGYVLSEDILSPVNIPPFPQSAMDGYAIKMDGDSPEFNLVGEVKAGDSGNEISLNKGEAVRIFTGAMVPEDADCVVMQEKVERNENKITITKDFKKGDNIRLAGEQIKNGELAYAKGAILTPPGIGFLSGMGIAEVPVIKKPVVSIINTGNELTKPGNPLSDGKIYESNSYTLDAALKSVGIYGNKTFWVEDTLQSTIDQISKSLESSDVVLLTGGISVGDYDFVAEALNTLGVTKVFHKIKQKPGKPLFFGKKGNKMVFALPGNPAAALTCFYFYVLPALRKLAGHGFKGMKKRVLPIKEEYIKRGDRAHMLKADFTDEQAEVLSAQSSAMLISFSYAKGLIYIPWDKDGAKQGELVDIYILPQVL